MEYRKIESHAYNIHIINTNKFKKNMIKINFRGKLVKEDIIKRKMITSILLDSNSIYQTKRLLDIKTEELYNLEGYNQTNISGNSLITSFNATFLNDKYTNEEILEECIKFESELILKPLIKDDKFQKKAFNKARDKVIEDINSIKENPKSYSIMRCLENMDKDIFSYREEGYLEDLENIDEKNLYKYYLEMLKTNKIDIFIIGEFNIDVKSIIEKYFNFNIIKKLKLNPYITHTRLRKTYRKIIEESNNSQTNLIMGYKIDKMNDFERQYVLPIYSYILGGGSDSRLFKNVREKNSLCYSIKTVPRPISSSLLIVSGIDYKNHKKAIKLIKKDIKFMEEGKFDDYDIEKAISIYINAYREIEDDLASIISKYVSCEYLNYDLIEDNMKNITKVTKKMVMELALKIHPDTIFILKGEEND